MDSPLFNASVQPGWVSLVVTAYNQERFLGESLESVLAQRYRPIECIIIDDGSTDATADIASRYTGRSEPNLQVRYFHQPNRGAQAARNQGLTLSRGEFIQHLDGDDVLDPDKLTPQVRFLGSGQGRDFDAVYGDANFLIARGESFETGEPLGMGPSDDFLVSLLGGAWNPNFAYLCRRSAVNRCGAWDEAIRINQDFDYFLRMACQGCRFAYLPIATGFYRKHGQGRISDKPLLHRARATFAILQSAEKTAVAAQSLTPSRRVAFAKAYQRVSYWSFGHDGTIWRASLNAALRLWPELCPEGSAARFLRRCLGIWTAETLLGLCRYTKAKMRMQTGRWG